MLKEIQLLRLTKEIYQPELLTTFKISNTNITENGVKFTSQLSKDINVLYIQGQISASSENEPPIYGHVFIDAKSFRTPYDVRWTWGLLPHDISTIEARRKGMDLQVSFSMNGICRDSEGEICSFFGTSLNTIASSEWEKVLDKYTLANNAAIPVPPSLFADRSWLIATEKIQNANNLLRRGETRLALKECLSQIEGYVTNPYDGKKWRSVFDKEEHSQRTEGLIALFSGISTFLNKVGHHRSKDERDENDQLILMPLDQYEAEIMQLMAHLAVVYLERLKANGTLQIDSYRSS